MKLQDKLGNYNFSDQEIQILNRDVDFDKLHNIAQESSIGFTSERTTPKIKANLLRYFKSYEMTGSLNNDFLTAIYVEGLAEIIYVPTNIEYLGNPRTEKVVDARCTMKTKKRFHFHGWGDKMVDTTEQYLREQGLNDIINHIHGNVDYGVDSLLA